MALPLSPQVFSIMSHLIEERTGLHYEPKDSDLFAERLSVRALELEIDSLLEYYYFLRYDEGGVRELDALTDHLVVNETYFFREADQLRALTTSLLPPLLERKPSVRIWSAACSSGEEPLTIAMLLDDQGLLDRAEILATDISTRALAKAQAGIYGGRALRCLPDADRSKHFVTLDDGLLRVREHLRARVRWQRLNLLDTARTSELGRFDVIICRNALIYFSDETVMRMVQCFEQQLCTDGLLLVGASESLLRFGTLLGCEEHGGAFFYRKQNA